MARTTFGIVLFDDIEELDFVGPWEVFGSVPKAGHETSVASVAQSGGAVRCANGLQVVADYGFADAPPFDVVLVPGGMGTRTEVDNPVLIEWLRGAARRCDWVTSVCTGSLLLHGAGLTKGRRITTHWAFVDTLRATAKDAQVLDDVRFIDDGNVVTAAGVSAGIDMALWLVGQIWDAETARNTQRIIQYEPEPPYAS